MNGLLIQQKNDTNWFSIKKFGKFIYIHLNDTISPFGTEKFDSKTFLKFNLSSNDTSLIHNLEVDIYNHLKTNNLISTQSIKSGIRYNSPFPNLLTTYITTFKGKKLVKISTSEANKGFIFTVDTIPKNTPLSVKIKLNGLIITDDDVIFYYTLDECVI